MAKQGTGLTVCVTTLQHSARRRGFEGFEHHRREFRHHHHQGDQARYLLTSSTVPKTIGNYSTGSTGINEPSGRLCLLKTESGQCFTAHAQLWSSSSSDSRVLHRILCRVPTSSQMSQASFSCTGESPCKFVSLPRALPVLRQL